MGAPIGASRAFALRRAIEGHHSDSMDPTLAEGAKERSIGNLQQNLAVPKPHQSLHRAQGPRRGVRPPSPMSHRTRIHRRIMQTALSWGKHRLRMRRGPSNPFTHPKNVHPLHKPSGKSTGRKPRDCPPGTTTHFQRNCRPYRIPRRLGRIYVHQREIYAQKDPSFI